MPSVSNFKRSFKSLLALPLDSFTTDTPFEKTCLLKLEVKIVDMTSCIVGQAVAG